MSVTDITSPHWRGERAAAIDPGSVRFTAIESPSNDCRSCMFNSQRGAVCDTANVIAERAGMPECCTGPEYIYVLDPSPQMWLVEVAQ
jgi:hypothetical protein